MAKEIQKIHVHKNKNGKYEAELEYRTDGGEVESGETKTFDNFSEASSWVAGIEVDLNQDETVEHNADNLS